MLKIKYKYRRVQFTNGPHPTVEQVWAVWVQVENWDESQGLCRGR